MTTSSFFQRALCTGTATAGLMVLGAGAALAHVSVSPTTTTEGGYSQLTFSVPNESETAGTNKLEVTLPAETPFTSVRVKPLEGWTAEVVRGALPEPVTADDGVTLTEAPLSIIWTAEEGAEISQDEYQTFSISVGKLPEAGTLVNLAATQTYTDGTVRAWDEPAAVGEAEPESPAPAFTTTPAEEGSGHGTAHSAGKGSGEGSADADLEPAAASEPSGSSAGSAAGWAGLTAGLLGLAAGVTALLRTRRRA
ncbi:YcnI family copper-binding membrane protein [Arthrobacter sp. TMN-37]